VNEGGRAKMKQTINYRSLDGTKLLGILESKMNFSKKCIIMCHGLKTNKDEYGGFKELTQVLANDYDTFRFDFRAHGESQGNEMEMTVKGLKEDLEATLLELILKRKYEEVCILGASFGGAILSLIDYERFPEVKKLIMWSASIDANKGNVKGSLGYENYKKAIEEGSVEIKSKTTGKIRKLSRTFMKETRDLKPEEKIKDINIPILFIHGTEDKTTPYEVNKQIAKECKKSCLVIIKGASHGLHEPKDIMLASKYIESFLKMKMPDIQREEDIVK